VKETDLAAAVVAYLRDLEWDVHQEVGGSYGPRADIAALRGRQLYIVETKLALGLAVIAQARHWMNRTHYVSVAVPMLRSSNTRDERHVAHQVLEQWGIGLLEVRGMGYETGSLKDWQVEETLPPRLCRRIELGRLQRLRASLDDGTRTYAQAGNADGRFWSPFKATVAEIHRALRDARRDLTTKELIDQIKHHYRTDATARSTLPRWLAYGKIPGVTAVAGRPLRWHLVA
jgi:hypothetical protein